MGEKGVGDVNGDGEPAETEAGEFGGVKGLAEKDSGDEELQGWADVLKKSHRRKPETTQGDAEEEKRDGGKNAGQ